MEYYLGAFKKYADFSGRARRKEFWMFVLFNSIAVIILGIIDYAIEMDILTTIYFLAVIVPALAIQVRRLHDIGKSGAWWFIYLIPIVGPIWMLVLSCTAGIVGENEYGEDPIEENKIQ